MAIRLALFTLTAFLMLAALSRLYVPTTPKQHVIMELFYIEPEELQAPIALFTSNP